MLTQILLWTGFCVYVLAMLMLDLKVLHRENQAMSVRKALIWSAIWIAQALIFNLGIYAYGSSTSALDFFAGYLIEESLSVDNLFVFLLIFSYFQVQPKYQHKVLYWGILGAMVMRAIMIALGTALIARFHWIIYIFGGFLIVAAVRMLFDKHEKIDPDNNPLVRLLKRFMPVTEHFHEDKFFVIRDNKLYATPLFVVLLVVEASDLVFALDSIPAIFSITTDPFIVYTSNVFAILGLRSLYFALAGVINLFRFLNIGLALVLGFVGGKMLLADYYSISTGRALWVVAAILTGSIGMSLLFPQAKMKLPRADEREDDGGDDRPR